MTSGEILAISDLSIGLVNNGRPIVQGVSMKLRAGEVLALIGESGSGKSTISLSCLGHVRPGLEVRSGRIRVAGEDVLRADDAKLRGVRGPQVAYIAQSAAASFNPVRRLNSQVIEAAVTHRKVSRKEASQRAISLYRELQLPQPACIGSRYPHEVSGGQLQRFMLAMGMMESPVLLVLDEPTSALDVTTQVEVLEAIRSAVGNGSTAGLFVTHDLPVVAQIADRVMVLRHGRVVEEGTTDQILTSPKDAYTRQLVEAFRPLRAKVGWEPFVKVERSTPVIEVENVTAGYGAKRLDQMKVVAVQDVSFTLHAGQVLAVVGESGSGKSSLAQVVAGLLPPVAGTVRLKGQPLAPTVPSRPRDQLRRVQILFQMADTALNPQHTVGRTLERVLAYFSRTRRSERSKRVIELLEMVQLPPSYASRLPGQLSGGEKQRVNLARALAADPEVLICDEITSALDTVVASKILALIERLRSTLGLSVIFISHDLPKVGQIADHVMVMQHGQVVESGSSREVLDDPKHPYTRLLLGSVPELRRGWLADATEKRALLLRNSAVFA